MEETESSACSVVLDNVRRQAFVRSVNLKAFFKPFDSLNHGEVSLPQFHRVLDIAGIRLTEEEATQVAKVYISPLTGAVKYRQFCCDVDKVFRSSELENDPYLVPLRPGKQNPSISPISPCYNKITNPLTACNSFYTPKRGSKHTYTCNSKKTQRKKIRDIRQMPRGTCMHA